MKISSEYDKSTPRSSPTKQGGQPPPLVGCSSFPGSSWKWGAAASWAAKTASQSPSMNSLTEDDDKSSLFIYQTWIFCKKNGSKRSFLSEIGAQTFCYALYAVTTACCISWQISKLEIWRNTAGKSARHHQQQWSFLRKVRASSKVMQCVRPIQDNKYQS